MIYGYFIAKVKDNNLSFLLKRFNEKYPQKSNLHIKFFDETPLTIRRIRYNQNGPICYCMQDTNIGRQKSSNIWKEITCSEDCEYRTRAKDGSKPLCNLEATLKFILPEISTDRVWLMKITGYTSIKRLNGYGITPVVVDPWASEKDAMHEYGVTLTKLEDVKDADCVIVAVAHNEFRALTLADIKAFFKDSADNEKVLLDVKGLYKVTDLEASGIKWWRL